jgi:beta-phosphoglucomutase-like phosphatase (HAD superfamily)
VKRRRFSARAVLFDWDGTLVNSYGADSRAYLAMFEALGVTWGLDDLARHYSPNWYRVYRAARLPRAKWDEADRIWTLAYKRENPRLMPGARQIIRTLKQEFILGLVTREIGPGCANSLGILRSPIISPHAFAAKTRQKENLTLLR